MFNAVRQPSKAIATSRWLFESALVAVKQQPPSWCCTGCLGMDGSNVAEGGATSALNSLTCGEPRQHALVSTSYFGINSRILI
jgi:hypothetical protein